MPHRAFSQEEKQNSTINIGLLVPDTSHWWSVTNLNAFVEKANRSGGYQDHDFRLIIRTTDGPWGTGSKESVALVYEDHVCAILGLQDGRGAHLTEQVIAKTHVAYIECLATESTLSQAFVPFFFRMVPNDDQQAESILELIKEKGGGKICILSTETYDARYAVRSLVKAAALKTGQAPLVIDVDSLEKDHNTIIDRIRSRGVKHLIIPFDSEENRDILLALKKEIPSVHTYGTLHFTTGAEIRKVPWRDYEGMYLVSVGPTWMGNKYLWGVSRISSCSDALNLVIQAIREVGPDRQAIIDYLAKIKTNGYHSGPISFDEYGNRTREPVFSKIQDGERVFH
jgi:ABC-type branched-subunit amino acid transport system substrate-binding protein